MGEFDKATTVATQALADLPADAPAEQQAQILLERAYAVISNDAEAARRDVDRVLALKAQGTGLSDKTLLQLNETRATLAFVKGERGRALEYAAESLRLSAHALPRLQAMSPGSGGGQKLH